MKNPSKLKIHLLLVATPAINQLVVCGLQGEHTITVKCTVAFIHSQQREGNFIIIILIIPSRKVNRGKMGIDWLNLTTAQRMVMVVFPMFSGSISIIGSSLIMVSIIRRKMLKNGPYHRLMVGISVYDLICSSWVVLSTLPFPKELGALGARGNLQTCSARGFFYTYGLGTLTYNASLSVFFLMAVKTRPSNQKLTKHEIGFHLAAFLIPTIMGISGLILKLFNNSLIPELACWAAPYPPGCDVFADISTCTRGRYYAEWTWAYMAIQFTLLAIIISCTLTLYLRVRSQGNRIRRVMQRTVRHHHTICHLYHLFSTCFNHISYLFCLFYFTSWF